MSKASILHTLAVLIALAQGAPRDSVPAERGTAREWYQNAKFGMHVLDWKDSMLALPSLGARRWTARSWPDGKALALTQTSGGLTLTLPPATDQPDRVVLLTGAR